MKKELTLFALFGAVACQPQAAQTTATATAASVAPDTTRPGTVAKAVPPLPVLFAPADTLTPPMRKLLQAHDLSALWKNREESAEPNPSFDGFFGPDHYRFGMVFTEVRRDPTNPARYLVQGKCNYHKSKNIRSFSGALTVRQVADLRYPGFLRARSIQFSEAVDSVAGRLYTARAQLQLQESPQANSGVFEGEVLLDFYVVPGQPADYVYVFDREGYVDELPTRGGRLLLRGNRRNVTTGQVKSFLVAPEVAAVAPNIFKDFMLDERMGQVNPKYAKLGWNEYWQNDEWWADPPEPRLNL